MNNRQNIYRIDITEDTQQLSDSLKYLNIKKIEFENYVNNYHIDEEKNKLVNKYLEVRFQYAYYEFQYTLEDLQLSKLQIQIINELVFNITLFNSNVIKGEEIELDTLKSLATDIKILFTMLDDRTILLLENAVAFGDLALKDYIHTLPKMIEFFRDDKILELFKSLKLNRVRIRSTNDKVFDADIFENIIELVNKSEENIIKHSGVSPKDNHNWPS